MHESLQSYAEKAFQESNGDALAAAELLTAWAQKNQELYRELTTPYLTAACWELITKQCQRERRMIWEPPQSSVVGRGDRIQYLAVEQERQLLNMNLPIPGEPQLGKATKEQVEMAASYYLSRAKNMRDKAMFLQLIAKKAKPEKTIAEQFTEVALRKLKAQAIGGGS